MSTAPVYDSHRTKATTLRSLALWYIHCILSHTLTECGDSTGVVSYRDFDFLLSIVDEFHLHISYEVAISIAHHGTNPCIGALFVGPYITGVIRYVDLFNGTNRIRIVGGFAAMSRETLRSMGMLQHVYTTTRVEYRV